MGLSLVLGKLVLDKLRWPDTKDSADTELRRGEMYWGA